MVRSGWFISIAAVRKVLLASVAAVLLAVGVGPAGTSVRAAQPPDTRELAPARDPVPLKPGEVVQRPPVPPIRTVPAPQDPRRPVAKDNVLLPARGVVSESQAQRPSNAAWQPGFNQAGPPPGSVAGGGDVGACCYDLWGNCTPVTESSCVSGGGRFKGVGTECSESACSGACCFGTSCGDSYGLGRCALDGGSYQGDGRRCTDLTIQCPPTTGACCTAATCSDVTPGECTAPAGRFLGLGWLCSSDVSCDPPEVFGACCFSDGSCYRTTTARCASAGGTHRGQGTYCGGNICRGACCFPWSCEDNYPPFWCAIYGGGFQGLGTGCSDETVGCPMGACCWWDGSCYQWTGEYCTNQGGDFHGVRTSCNEAVCTGACCPNVGSCFESGPQQCDGAFHGLGTTCATVQCPGACCLTDGDCRQRSQTDCEALGGVYQGDSTACDSLTCRGACCDDYWGDCWDSGPENCSGTFHGLGSSCAEVVCKGACCESESCDERAPLGCSGIFHGLGTSCESVNCPFGACCFDGFCRLTVEEVCTRDGRGFRGVGSRCEEVACAGACCAFASSGCVNGIGPLTCAQFLDGVFQGDGSTCTDARDCPNTLGACCGSFGFGTPTPAPTARLQLPIVAGVVGSASCMDGVTAFECALFAGEFREGMDCAAAGCQSSLCPGVSPCCTPHRSLGCSDVDCCQTVCSVDPWCCIDYPPFPGWDDLCIDLANRLCGGGTGGYCAWRLADLNGDGAIDLRDYQLFQIMFGR